MAHLKRVFVAAALLILLPGQADAQDHHEHAAWSAGSWSAIESEGSPIGRHEHGYVQIGDLFYLMGGRGDRPVQSYDPATNTWTTLGLPPHEIHHFQAVAYQDKVYILGAFTGGWPTETPIPHIYVYDPAADTWTVGPAIPEDRRRGAAGVVMHEGQFYLVGGIINGHTDGHVAWLDQYDPDSDTWTPLADAPRSRDHFQAVVLDGKLYAAGGRLSSYGTGQSVELTIPEVDVYDFATDSWTTLPPEANLPTERAGTTALAFHGRLVVIGGESAWGLQQSRSSPPAHAEVEAFDPGTASWTVMPSLTEGLHGFQAIHHGGKIYIASGSRTVGATEVTSHLVYSLPE